MDVLHILSAMHKLDYFLYFVDNVFYNFFYCVLHMYINGYTSYIALVGIDCVWCHIIWFMVYFPNVCEPLVGSTSQSLWFPTICLFGLSGRYLQGIWQHTSIDLKHIYINKVEVCLVLRHAYVRHPLNRAL